MHAKQASLGTSDRVWGDARLIAKSNDYACFVRPKSALITPVNSFTMNASRLRFWAATSTLLDRREQVEGLSELLEVLDWLVAEINAV